MTTKINTARKLTLTSRAKMGAARKPARATKRASQQAPATDLKAALAASIEQVAAQSPAGPGLDGDAAMPAEQIGEVVRPAKAPTAKAKAKKASKPPHRPRRPAQAQGVVTLVREPGRGFFRLHVDGAERGTLFSTTARVADGHGGTKPARRWAATARYLGHEIRTDAPSKQAALDQFMKLWRNR